MYIWSPDKTPDLSEHYFTEKGTRHLLYNNNLIKCTLLYFKTKIRQRQVDVFVSRLIELQ
jgi:hypothetical protein